MYAFKEVTLAFALLLANTTATHADEYYVSSKFPETIQTLIDLVVVDGDVILLGPGEFTLASGVQIENASITIRGTVEPKTGELLTTLDGVGISRILYINHDGCTVEKIRFLGGDSRGNGTGMFDDVGGAIFGDTESNLLSIRLSEFEQNSASYGGAIYLRGDDASIDGCSFSENQSDLNGAGLALFDANDATISECIFESNVSGNDGGAMYLVGQETTITSCQVIDNQAVSVGGILVPSGTSTMLMANTEVCGNSPVQVFGEWTDLGGNSIGDACDCTGDIDGDGTIGGVELGLLFSLWGTSNPLLDLDGDGTTGASDLGILLSLWGPCQ